MRLKNVVVEVISSEPFLSFKVLVFVQSHFIFVAFIVPCSQFTIKECTVLFTNCVDTIISLRPSCTEDNFNLCVYVQSQVVKPVEPQHKVSVIYSFSIFCSLNVSVSVHAYH